MPLEVTEPELVALLDVVAEADVGGLGEAVAVVLGEGEREALGTVGTSTACAAASTLLPVFEGGPREDASTRHSSNAGLSARACSVCVCACERALAA